MSKTLLATILLLAVVMAVIILSRRSAPAPWQPRTRLSFVGFMTNSTGTNAQFGVDDHGDQDTATWTVREISHREGTNWIAWDPDRAMTFDWFYPTQPSSSSLHVHVLVPVETTNSVSRIVIQLQKSPEGAAARFFEKLRVRWALFQRRSIDTAFHGPSVFLTNETVIKTLP